MRWYLREEGKPVSLDPARRTGRKGPLPRTEAGPHHYQLQTFTLHQLCAHPRLGRELQRNPKYGPFPGEKAADQ